MSADLLKPPKVKSTLRHFSVPGETWSGNASGLILKVQSLSDGSRHLELGPIGEGYWVFKARSAASLAAALRYSERLNNAGDAFEAELASIQAEIDAAGTRTLRLHFPSPDTDIDLSPPRADETMQMRWMRKFRMAARAPDRWLATWARRRGAKFAGRAPDCTISVGQDGVYGSLWIACFRPTESAPKGAISLSPKNQQRVYFVGDQVENLLKTLHEAAVMVRERSQGHA